MAYTFPVTRTTHPNEKPDQSNLGFGKYFTDHMFIMNYDEGPGWHDARIEHFHNMTLSPAPRVFHYGQTMFEGLKAYKGDNGEVYLFRPDMNAKRANNSNARLCIPKIPEEDFVQAIKTVVDVDRDWIPDEPGYTFSLRSILRERTCSCGNMDRG